MELALFVIFTKWIVAMLFPLLMGVAISSAIRKEKRDVKIAIIMALPLFITGVITFLILRQSPETVNENYIFITISTISLIIGLLLKIIFKEKPNSEIL